MLIIENKFCNVISLYLFSNSRNAQFYRYSNNLELSVDNMIEVNILISVVGNFNAKFKTLREHNKITFKRSTTGNSLL